MDAKSLIGGEEMDADFFVPPQGSNLASIFGKNIKTTSDGNDSLKYTPPKLPNVATLKEVSQPEEMDPSQVESSSKTSECVLAKAVHAYELINGAYESRGKLGLAVMKVFDPLHTRIVLFMANKITISSATISQYFEITIQTNNYITYYDDNSKNWSLMFATPEDLHEVLSELKNYHVKVNQPNENPTLSISTTITEAKAADNIKANNIYENEHQKDVEQPRKNDKIALLNRMAHVGQSVLPRPVQLPAHGCPSDSSDEGIRAKGLFRNKASKTSVSRRYGNGKPIVESSDSSAQDNIDGKQITTLLPTHLGQPMPICNYTSGQFVPIASNEGQGLNVFFSETRASNSEVRINLNRLSDKVDQVLDKLKLVNDSRIDRNPSFTVEVFQKLLLEYEDKIRVKDVHIKLLEDKLANAVKVGPSPHASQNSEINHQDNDKFKSYEELIHTHESVISENAAFRIKLETVENTLTIKTEEIEQLKHHIDVIENKIKEAGAEKDKIDLLKRENDMLTIKIVNLEDELNARETKLTDLNLAYNEICTNLKEIKTDNKINLNKDEQHSDLSVIDTKIKIMMNNTYKALATNFDNDSSYTGKAIRNTIASIIRQTTLDALSSS